MRTEILGNKPKHNFDDNLADVVNKFYENQPDITDEKPKDKLVDSEIKIYSSNTTMTTYNQWIKYYSERNENIALMSDYYHALRASMYKISFDPLFEQKAEILIENLRRDAQFGCFTGGGLVGHTAINYLTDQNSASIADYFINVHGIMSRGMAAFSVPVLGDSQSPNSSRIKGEILLRDLLSINSGVDFIRNLFKTEDSADQIVEVFKFFGNTAQEHKLNVLLPKIIPQNQGIFHSCVPIIRINGGIVEIVLSEHEIEENVIMWRVKHDNLGDE